MKILIVEDESLSMARLDRLLRELDLNNIQQASSGQEAIDYCKVQNFDLVFLDINLSDMSGIELAYEIKKLISDIIIIFQTAYDSYAISAYRVGAIDYLLKPYSKNDLQDAINRAKKQLKNSFSFIIKNEDKYIVLNPNDIIYIKADLSRVIIRTKDEFLYHNIKISELKNKLEAFGFFRVHRSYIININKIKNITTLEQSRLEFYFYDIYDVVESSKDGAKEFRRIHQL